METKKGKRLNVLLEDELHRQMKADAAQKGMTVSAYVIEAITEKVERDKEGD